MEVPIVTILVFALAVFTLGYMLGISVGIERFKIALDALKKEK